MQLKLGGTEYRIKYGFEATTRSGIIKKLARLTADENEDTLDRAQNVLEFLPEMVLVGLQRFHGDEFGYDYTTGDGKEKQINKVYGLLEDYFDEDGADFMELLSSLQAELTENGFLAKMLRDETEKVKEQKK